MSITPRKLKDGATVYDVTLEYGVTRDGKRDRQRKTYATKAEAERADAHAKELRRAMKNRTGRIRLSDYIDLYYWPIASRRLAATSLDTYEKEIRLRIKPCLGDCYLTDLDRMKVQRMIDVCATQSVAKKALSTLKTILNEAVGDGLLNANPACARFAMPAQGKKRDNGVILGTFEEIGQFIAAVKNDAPEPILRLVITGLLLGLRPEERYALDWSDFAMPTFGVHVQRAYVSTTAARGTHQMKEPKTELSNRIVYMPPAFVDFYMQMPNESGAFIKNANGERLSPSTAQKMWRRYLAKHPDLPQVTLENMRHSFATACLHDGMNVEDLSRIMGHSDINTTYKRYVKPSSKNLEDAMWRLPFVT